MGGSSALGLSRFNAVKASDITVTAKHQATLDKFISEGMNASLNNAEAAKGADIVVLAVKPWLIESVVKEILPVLDLEKQLIVSFAPGVKAAQLMEWLGGNAKLAYVIPNTAIEVGESMTFITAISATEEQTALLAGLFAKVGLVKVVDEAHLMPGTSLASCGIAYAFRYIRAAAEGGVELGFYAKDATEIVAQTVKGAASLLEAHKSHPEAEIDKVTTPGGLTIKGLNAMEEAGFTNAVIQGLRANK